MPSLTPEFDENEIKPYFDHGAWGRGLGYARYGHIIEGRVEGDTLYADCVGSQPYPYHVRASWRNGRLVAHCTCPIGALGDCKHVVALLMTWIEHPQDFVREGAIETMLAEAPAERLRKALAGIIEHYPQTQKLVAQYLQGPESWSAEMVRREVERAMTDAVDRGWNELWDSWQQALPQEVTSWITRLEQCRASANYDSLLEITNGLTQGLLQFIDTIDDAVLFCLQEVVEALTDLVAPYRPTDIRQLAAIRLANVALGQGGTRRLLLSTMARDALINHLDKKERRRLAREVKRDLMRGPWHVMRPPFHIHEARFYYALIEADSLAPTTRLQHAQDLNDPIMAIDMMLELGYKEKQFQLLAYAEPRTVEEFLEPFERRGLLNEALDWMIDHDMGSTGYHNWLASVFKRHGRWDALLHLAWGDIRDESYPYGDGKPRIDPLREVAQEAGVWDDERAKLIAHYAEIDAWHRIVRINLDDNLWDEALVALDRVTQDMVYYDLQHYREEIAAEIQQARPLASALILAEHVEMYIGNRTRAYYRRAAELLLRIRECHERAGQLERWEVYLADLRDDYGRLPALADEMRQVGL